MVALGISFWKPEMKKYLIFSPFFVPWPTKGHEVTASLWDGITQRSLRTLKVRNGRTRSFDFEFWTCAACPNYFFFPFLLACRHFLSPFNNFFFSISRFFSQLMVHCYSFFSLTFISNLPLIIFYIACDSRKRNNHVM